MEIYKKGSFVLITSMLLLLFDVKSDNIPFQGWWFNGKMRINSASTDLSYKVCTWSAAGWVQGLTLKANIDIDILELMGGPSCLSNSLACLNMSWWAQSQIGMSFFLVPDLPFIPGSDGKANGKTVQQFYDDLHAGKTHPYILIARNSENLITIYILGPTGESIYNSEKISFNIRAFEYTWVQPSWWYNGLGNDGAPGFSLGCSFNADGGGFLKGTDGHLSNDAFYIAPFTSPLSPSWFTVGKQVMPNATFTLQALIDGYQYAGNTYGAGIIDHKGPPIDAQELQSMINFLNSTGLGKFANVY